MPDINKNAADQGNAGGEGGNAGADNKNSADTGDDKGGDAGGENGGGGDAGGEAAGGDDKNKNAKAPEKKEPPKDDEDEDDDKEPPVKQRLSNKDHIIQRLQRKAKKNAAKPTDEGGEAGDDEGEGEIAPEDKSLIEKVVSPMLAPVLEKTMQASDKEEAEAFIAANPDFAPYKAKALKFMAHPSRRHLPVETIFFEVAGKNLLKIGAERQKKADEDAKNSQHGGGSNRGGEGAKDVWQMTAEEFEAEKQRIRQGQQ